MGANVLWRVAGEMTASVSGERYVSADTPQSFRSLQASSQVPLFFVQLTCKPGM